MHDWLIWIIATAALAGAESLSLDLVLIMFAGGTAAAAVTASFTDYLPGEVGVAAAVSLLLLLFLRPVAKRHLTQGPEHRSGAAKLVGMDAIVLRRVDDKDGLVRLNGGEWTARSFDVTQVMTPGTTVRVYEIDGAVAVVWDPALP